MTAADVGAAVVRPNVLRDCAAPNTLGGLIRVAPPPTRRPAQQLLLAAAVTGMGAVAVLAWLGR